MIKRPLVSVILPVNKNNPHLEEAIQSIKNQTYKELELIIIANNCEDTFYSLLLKYQDQKTKIIRTSIKYLPFSLNLGVHLSQGEYIARMDSDDISVLDRIEKQVKRFLNTPELSILGSNVEYINEASEFIGYSNYPLDHSSIVNSFPFRCNLAHPTIMVKKEVVTTLGGYMYGSLSEDYDLWIRASRHGNFKFSNIDEPLLKYRIHKGQATNKSNAYNIFAFDSSLKIREFLLNGNVQYLLGAARGFFAFIYVRFIKK
ncbi:glycosyltransferase [Chromobacterium violaceum]|uniref:glycosyltransferase n=1 Tax=Chromobacterium violaceum TaxID=536 RepID=UPI001E42C221|nr:glycosyltransferase [Chromobacterium violaceum]MCD0491992.1 glycosyltransferase [Chromobacterium violaceum]